jgi:hypothetical protein
MSFLPWHYSPRKRAERGRVWQEGIHSESGRPSRHSLNKLVRTSCSCMQSLSLLSKCKTLLGPDLRLLESLFFSRDIQRYFACIPSSWLAVLILSNFDHNLPDVFLALKVFIRLNSLVPSEHLIDNRPRSIRVCLHEPEQIFESTREKYIRCAETGFRIKITYCFTLPIRIPLMQAAFEILGQIMSVGLSV